MSRIIKSGQITESAVGDFFFKPIAQAANRATEQPDSGFVPMGIFDDTEMQRISTASPVEEPKPTGPPAVTITEEELDRQLRSSFERGLQEGKNLAERGLLNVFKSLRTAAEEVRNLREKVLRESEDELIRLIMLVARKVILREIHQDRRLVTSIVEAGIAAVPERDEITIRLNPDDYILITTGHDYLRNDLLSERVHLKSDPTIQTGCCQIDSEMGTLDASIDAQLDEIYRRLLEERTQAGEV